MRFTIDTNKKEIQLHETVNVSDLVNKLSTMLGDEYTEYTIVPKVEVIIKEKEVPSSPFNFPLVEPYRRTLENPANVPQMQEIIYTTSSSPLKGSI